VVGVGLRILVSVGVLDVTFSVAWLLTIAPMVALIIVVPAATPVATPLELMVATVELDDFQRIVFPAQLSGGPEE